MKRLNLAQKITKSSNHNSKKQTLVRKGLMLIYYFEFQIFDYLITFEMFSKVNFSYVCGIQVFVKYWIFNWRISCLF